MYKWKAEFDTLPVKKNSVRISKNDSENISS